MRIRYVFPVILFGLGWNVGTFASILSKRPSFEQRVKEAKYIFIGTPVFEKPQKSQNADADMVVTFAVDRVFKGDPGKKIEVYYLLLVRGTDQIDGGSFRPNMRQKYQYAIEHKIPELVFVKEINGELMTSPEIGGDTTVLTSTTKEIEKLTKMGILK